MSDVPKISALALGFFRQIARRYFKRHFRAVRLSRGERFREIQGPLIVYANHSSWWDPMVSVLLAAELMSGRKHYAPMDAGALERYGILKHIGIFPVEMKTARGAAQFLRTGLKVLADGGVLWVTPQGRFADPRERPLEFKAGLATLAARVPGGCTVLPLAIEYTFWDERLPEALLHFGESVRVSGENVAEVQESLKTALLRTMEELEQMAVARSPDGFTLLRQGRAGVGGFYALGQRLMARLRGKRYQAEHTAFDDLDSIGKTTERV
jgi:1-acyl-sn-glycerol-3-phosphate acyltransferase